MADEMVGYDRRILLRPPPWPLSRTPLDPVPIQLTDSFARPLTLVDIFSQGSYSFGYSHKSLQRKIALSTPGDAAAHG